MIHNLFESITNEFSLSIINKQLSYITTIYSVMSLHGQNRSISVQTMLWDGQGKRSHYTIPFKPVVGPTESHIKWVTMAFSLGIKWPWHEANHSQQSRSTIHNEDRCNLTLPHAFMACTGMTLSL
jgi:hypothetical protein